MIDCEGFAQNAQDKWATASESLRSLRGNERCEQITHFAQNKWATMSDLLSLLRGNEGMSWKNLKSCFTMFYLSWKFFWKNERIALFRSFPLFWWAMWVNCSFRSNQMSDGSESLVSLTKNERPLAICSGRSEEMREWVNCSFFWENRSFAHFWAKNKRFARKSNEQIPSPA